MGMMDMLNPMTATKKVAKGVQKVANKLPGARPVNNAMNTVSQKMLPNGWSPNPQAGGIGPSNGMMSKIAGNVGNSFGMKRPTPQGVPQSPGGYDGSGITGGMNLKLDPMQSNDTMYAQGQGMPTDYQPPPPFMGGMVSGFNQPGQMNEGVGPSDMSGIAQAFANMQQMRKRPRGPMQSPLQNA